jgi:hypothetical protein
MKFRSQEKFNKRPVLVINAQDYSRPVEFIITTTDDFTKYSQISIDWVNPIDASFNFRRILRKKRKINKKKI